MNVLNRIVIVILLLLAMVVCSVLLVVPAIWPENFFGTVVEQATLWAEWLMSLRPYARVALGGLFALTLNIIFIFLLIMELRRPKPKAIRVEKSAGGEILVSVASITDRLRYEVDLLPYVLRCKPKVSAKRGGVVVELDVETAAGVDVPEKAERIVETARLIVEERMGLKLARPPKVQLRAVPYPSTPTTPKRDAIVPTEAFEEEEKSYSEGAST
jgi:hypothetical protein